VAVIDGDTVSILCGPDGRDPFGQRTGVSVHLDVVRPDDEPAESPDLALLPRDGAFREAPLLAVLDTAEGRLIVVGHCQVVVQPRRDPAVRLRAQGLWLASRATGTARRRRRRTSGPAVAITARDHNWQRISHFDQLRELLAGWLRGYPHRIPSEPEARATVIAKAIAESSRDEVATIRAIRYDLERVIGSSLRRSRTHDLEILLADVVELTIAISHARDEATAVRRGGLGSWRSSPAAYHAQRRLLDPTLPRRSGALRARRQPWFAILDAGVRQCAAMDHQLTEESTLLHQLLDAAASVSVARDAQAQETFTLVATVGAVLVGVPAMIIALYGATAVLPLSTSNAVVLLPIAGAGLVAGVVAAFLPGRERAGKTGRFLVTLAAALTTIVLLAIAGSLVTPQP
jgi:hypothetical protein